MPKPATLTAITVNSDNTLNGDVNCRVHLQFRMYYALQMYYANGGGPCYINCLNKYGQMVQPEIMMKPLPLYGKKTSLPLLVFS